MRHMVTGLDSAAAASVVEKLRVLANQGKTIIAVIHQPSQHVFSMFDDLLLLSDGRQMYYGPVKEVRWYMEHQGMQHISEILHSCVFFPETSPYLFSLKTLKNFLYVRIST